MTTNKLNTSNQNNQLSLKIFLLFITTMLQNCEGCNKASNKLNEAENECLNPETDIATDIEIDLNKSKNFDDIDKEIIDSVENLTDKDKLKNALYNFSKSFADVELIGSEKSSKMHKAMKNAVKLGIFPKEYADIYDQNYFKDSDSLVSNILIKKYPLDALKQIYGRKPHDKAIFHDTFYVDSSDEDDYTDKEKSDLRIAQISRSIASYKIIETIIDSNPEVEFPEADKKIIKETSKKFTDFFNKKNKILPTKTGIIANTENLEEMKNDLQDSTELLFGETDPLILKNIDKNSLNYNQFIKSENNSIVKNWIQSKALRNGSWQSAIKASNSDNSIVQICEDLSNLFEFYKNISPESDIEILKKQYKNFNHISEKGEKAIEKLKKILNEKGTYIDKSDNTERIGLRWVGQWRKDASEEQISAKNAIELQLILDWMSAFTIALKHKDTIQVPLLSTQSILSTYGENKLWYKESAWELDHRNTEKIEKYLAVGIALSPILLPVGMALGIAAGALTLAGLIVAAPIVGTYYALK